MLSWAITRYDLKKAQERAHLLEGLLIAATGLGAIGGIAGGFAMSFLVFDETGSTLASVSYTHLDVYKRQALRRAVCRLTACCWKASAITTASS